MLDGYLRIRLIAQYTSGRFGIYTLSPSGGSMLWICEGPISTEGVPNPLPQGSFVIDCKSGNKLKTNRARLGEPTRSMSSKDPHCVFVTCGSKGAKCFANINGTLIAKTDWGGKIGVVQGSQIVERLGECPIHLFHVLAEFDR
jgi:syntaxin-binding protein 5